MKVNLAINGIALNGYLNLDPLTQPNDKSKVNHTLDNIDDLVDNNECEEVLAYGVIDVFPIEVKKDKLTHWASKVEHKGLFVFSGTDIRKVTKLISDERMDLKNSNAALYGNPAANPWTTKRSLWTLEEARNAILSTQQFNIVSIEYVGTEYVIKVQRI